LLLFCLHAVDVLKLQWRVVIWKQMHWFRSLLPQQH